MSKSKSNFAPLLENVETMLFEKGYRAVCGVDEVGRGPLAGPVVAAAVIMPHGTIIEGLTDSKKLSEAKREQIFEEIIRLNLPCAIGIIDHEGIDKMNILQASLMAMRKAIHELKKKPDFVLVDGNHPVPKIIQPQFAIVGGDGRCDSIAAASVIAKVTRDKIMMRYDELYPSFSFAQHKGYPTALHIRELKEAGPTDIHRKTFKPVSEIINQYALFS